MRNFGSILVLAFICLGATWAGWTSVGAHEKEEIINYLPHCAPKEGKTEQWKTNADVGKSKNDITKKFGKPDGVFRQPYYFVNGSDETWLYHGKGTLYNRKGKHIFVFAKGRCLAASDDFIYTDGSIKNSKKSR